MLYGATTRALLAYLHHRELIRMHWSPLLIVEMSRALVKTGRLTSDEALANEDALQRSVPGGSVPTVDLHAAFKAAWPGVNDSKDLHVAACAVALHARAYYPSVAKVHLITRNAKDFAPKKLATMNVVQRHPDAFLLELWEHEPADVAEAFRTLRLDLPSQPGVEALLDKLARDGQRRTATSMLTAHASALRSL